MSSALKPELLRIGELAERSGVSVATIKFYIREGLLPPPPVKTGRTMAYYDQAYLERLLRIRRLREEQLLPLRAIRAILNEEADAPLSAEESELLAKVGPRALARLDAETRAHLPRAEVLARWGLRDDELDLLVELGLVGEGGDFSPADQELFDALAQAEQGGLTRERFPLEGMGHYVELLGELARREVRVFSHLAGHAPENELGGLAEQAAYLSEPIVTLVRRKLLARALRAELAARKPRRKP